LRASWIVVRGERIAGPEDIIRFTREQAYMARISLVEPENASAEVKEIYEKALKGKPGNIQKAIAHRPEVLRNFLPFYASVGRSLERKLYEEIYIRVSWLNGCNY
jgi:alkylhydroperoxidase family enzyme